MAAKEKMVMPIPDLRHTQSDIITMLYHFLREAPGWRGYSVVEATKLVAHRLKKKNIPFSMFIEFSEEADRIYGQSQLIIQQIIKERKQEEIF